MAERHRKGRDPSRTAGRAFRPLARLLHRRPRGRAPLSRLFDPRPRRRARRSRKPATCCCTASCRRARSSNAFDAELKAARALPAGILDIIRTVRAAHPMDVLRTAVSALAAFDPEVGDTFRAGDAAQGRPAHGAGADDHRRARGASATTASRPSPDPRPAARRQLPLHADRPRAERQCRATDGRRHDPARRARLERVGVHGAGRRRHEGEPARGDHRGDRRAVRPVARRGRGERDAGWRRKSATRRGPPTTSRRSARTRRR